MTVTKQLIDNVNKIKTTLNEISVYNLDVKTAIELYYELAKKVNEVINELSRFEGVVSDELIKQNEKLIYLLGEGLKEQVVIKIDNLIKDGTIQDLINNKIFNELNNKIDTFIQGANEKFNTIERDFNSQLEHKANKNIWGYNQVILPFTFPKKFNWSGTLPNVKLKGDGQCIHNIDVSNYEIKGKTYYVDIKTGLGDNDGLSPETPLSNIQVAIDKGDADTIIVGSGWYEHNHGYASKGVLINSSKKPVSIKAKGDGDVYISANSYNLSFSLEGDYTNVYSASRSGVGRVIDIKYKDNVGEFLELTKVSSIAEVENRANSYFTDNVKVYIHTKDNRNPDSDIKCLFNTIYPLQFHKDLYLEGINLIGGKSPLKGGSGAKLYAKDCEFKFSTLENGISINSSFGVLQNCNASNNYLDGFNYNGGNIIETDCKAFRNGIIGIGLVDTQNGSTQHNGGKIIRINCEYGYNKGSNLGDNHSNTQSVNFNIISHDSNSETERYNSNFTAHTNANVWLVNCVSYGSKRDFLAEEGAKLYYNSDTINYNNFSIEGSGSIVNE